jgi:hypothetical protein
MKIADDAVLIVTYSYKKKESEGCRKTSSKNNERLTPDDASVEA